MGEYADMAVEAMFDEYYHDQSDFYAEDCFADDYTFNGRSRRQYKPKTKECKHCGAPNLHWEQRPEGWRLVGVKFEDETEAPVHKCPLFKKSA